MKILNKVFVLVVILYLVAPFISMITLILIEDHERDVNTRSIYDKRTDELNRIVLFLQNNPQIIEVTKERPSIFDEYDYIKIDELYYITESDANIDNSSVPAEINTLFDDVKGIFSSDNGNIIEFQTISALGYGELIIYTKYGNEHEDKYYTKKETINENWYIVSST